MKRNMVTVILSSDNPKSISNLQAVMDKYGLKVSDYIG